MKKAEIEAIIAESPEAIFFTGKFFDIMITNFKYDSKTKYGNKSLYAVGYPVRTGVDDNGKITARVDTSGTVSLTLTQIEGYTECDCIGEYEAMKQAQADAKQAKQAREQARIAEIKDDLAKLAEFDIRATHTTYPFDRIEISVTDMRKILELLNK